MANTGAQFVKNYLNRDWLNEKKQDRWTLCPNETNINKLLILYNFTDENVIFKNLQLVFEITIHEEHPYKAPSIKTMTPNGRTQLNQSICIDGLTAWHPESWKIVTSMNSIIERFLSAFIDIENIEKGVGFIQDSNHETIRKFADKSHAWNWENYREIVDIYLEQLTENIVLQNVNNVPKIETSFETEYIYSDDES
jgi:ubiquitin-protein ligase